jgi:hypothetical protein
MYRGWVAGNGIPQVAVRDDMMEFIGE